VFFALLWAALSLAADSPACHSAAARKIEVPMYPGNEKSRAHFSYTYAVGGEPEAKRPWIVVLPGGPGQASIPMPLAMPSGFPILRIDPRGVGCNSEPKLPVKALASAFAAADVAAVIRKENLKSYILYGASYGTLLATLVAEKLEQDGGPPPRAIVLEGVLGRAFEKDGYLKPTLARWKAVREQLRPETRAELSSSPLPFGASSLHWAAYISSLLYAGVPAGGTEDMAVDQLERLRNPKLRPFVEKQIERAVAAPDPDRLRIFREVTCREIAPDMRDLQFDYELKEGVLIPRETSFCQGIKPGPLYDSAKAKLKSPLYYFSGALDPSTPPSEARYHLEHQPSSSRTLVRVPRGGHLALSLNLSDCAPALWEAIAEGKPLKDLLAGCLAEPKPTLESLLPEKD